MIQEVEGKKKFHYISQTSTGCAKGSRQSGRQRSRIRVTLKEDPSSYLDWSLEK